MIKRHTHSGGLFCPSLQVERKSVCDLWCHYALEQIRSDVQGVQNIGNWTVVYEEMCIWLF